jgi:hypothetical protein
MTAAKIFMNGRSQAIRLPKEFRVNSDEVFLKKPPAVLRLWNAIREKCLRKAATNCPAISWPNGFSRRSKSAFGNDLSTGYGHTHLHGARDQNSRA